MATKRSLAECVTEFERCMANTMTQGPEYLRGNLQNAFYSIRAALHCSRKWEKRVLYQHAGMEVRRLCEAAGMMMPW